MQELKDTKELLVAEVGRFTSDIDTNNQDTIAAANMQGHEHNIGVAAWEGPTKLNEDSIGFAVEGNDIDLVVADGVGSSIFPQEASKAATQTYVEKAGDSEPLEVIDQITNKLYLNKNGAFKRYIEGQLNEKITPAKKSVIEKILKKCEDEDLRQGLFEWVNDIDTEELDDDEIDENIVLKDTYNRLMLVTTLKGAHLTRHETGYKGKLTSVGDSLAFKINLAKGTIERKGTNQGTDQVMYDHAKEIADYFSRANERTAAVSANDSTEEFETIDTVDEVFLKRRDYEETTGFILDAERIETIIHRMYELYRTSKQISMPHFKSVLEEYDYSNGKELDRRNTSYRYFLTTIFQDGLSTDEILQNPEKIYFLLRTLYPGENGVITKSLKPVRSQDGYTECVEDIELEMDEILILSTDGIDLIPESKVLEYVKEEKANYDAELSRFVEAVRQSLNSDSSIDNEELAQMLAEAREVSAQTPDFDLESIVRKYIGKNLSLRISERLILESNKLNLPSSQDNMAIIAFEAK